MNTDLLKRIARFVGATIVAFAGAVSFTGCSAIMDDEPEPCPVGLKIRFVYDYNLERANAFHNQVDCLTVHFYDADGKYVMTRTETSDVLADEDYRMTVDLPQGHYTIIAYGGVECDKASFSHTNVPAEGSDISELGMQLKPETLEPGNPKGHLHDHFYGRLEADVKVSPERPQVTVKMMKDTNHFRFILQQLSYEPLDGRDYEFKITDDNSLFDYTNMLVDNGQITYTPWSTGAIELGTASDGFVDLKASDNEGPDQTLVKVAYADLSTSRLMLMRAPRLSVVHKESGDEIISIPLNKYLLATRSFHYDWCGDQEYLDRKSDWSLIFLLDNPRQWHTVSIKIDDWVVRINDIDAKP